MLQQETRARATAGPPTRQSRAAHVQRTAAPTPRQHRTRHPQHSPLKPLHTLHPCALCTTSNAFHLLEGGVPAGGVRVPPVVALRSRARMSEGESRAKKR
eukprot:2109051-Rhodomonas_salina.1